MMRLEVGRGGDQLEDPLTGGSVEAGWAPQELDVEPDRFARPQLEPRERDGHFEDRAGRRFDRGPVRDHAAGTVQVADRSRLIRLHHDDFTVGGLDEADPEAVGLGEDLVRGPSLGIDADEQSLGIETEPYRFDRSAGNLSHGAALVSAGVVGGVDPFKIGCAAVDLDVRKAARLGVNRRGTRCRGRLRRRANRAGRSPVVYRRCGGACETGRQRRRRGGSNDRRRTTRTSPIPGRCRSRSRLFQAWPRRAGASVPRPPGTTARRGAHPRPRYLRSGRPRSRSCG